jgi:hypothetical protein
MSYIRTPRKFRSETDNHSKRYRLPVIPTLLGALAVLNVASAVLTLIE